MGYKVYAGKTAYLLASDFDIVPSFENGKFTTQGFYWTEKELIYDSNGDSVTGEEPGKILIDPTLSRKKNEYGSFECTIPEAVETMDGGVIRNPLYGKAEPYQTTIMVEEDGKPIWAGYVREVERDFDRNEKIYAEGALGQLGWWSTGFDETEYKGLMSGSESLLYDLIHNQTGRFESPFGQFALGMVTIPEPGYVKTDQGFVAGTLWDYLNSRFLDEYDGYLRMRIVKSDDTYSDKLTADPYIYAIVVDYLVDIPEETKQKIEYGVNLLDLTYLRQITSNMVGAVTAWWTKTVKKGWWIFKTATSERNSYTVTSDRWPKGVPLVEKAITLSGDNITEAEAKKKAEEELANYDHEIEPELTVKAFDQVDAGVATDRIGFLKKTHILSKPHGIDLHLVCTEESLPLAEPDNKTFTYGLPPKKLTDTSKMAMVNTLVNEHRVDGIVDCLK